VERAGQATMTRLDDALITYGEHKLSYTALEEVSSEWHKLSYTALEEVSSEWHKLSYTALEEVISEWHKLCYTALEARGGQ
jgi:hypothetical protein